MVPTIQAVPAGSRAARRTHFKEAEADGVAEEDGGVALARKTGPRAARRTRFKGAEAAAAAAADLEVILLSLSTR